MYKFHSNPSNDHQDISPNGKNVNILVVLGDKSIGLTINVCAEFYLNLSTLNKCWDISVWTKVVDRQTNRQTDIAIPRAMPLSMAKKGLLCSSQKVRLPSPYVTPSPLIVFIQSLSMVMEVYGRDHKHCWQSDTYLSDSVNSEKDIFTNLFFIWIN